MGERVTSLPRGPGLRWRWTLATPMMVVSMFAPWFGQLVLLVWWSSAFDDILGDLGRDEPEPTFWAEFGEKLSGSWYNAWVPAVVLAWFLLRRGRIAPWPTACLTVSVIALLPSMFVLGTGDDSLPNIAFAVALAWLSWELARQTVKVLTRPIARDIVESTQEIPYQLPGRRQRLRIQQDELVLDRLRHNKEDLKRRIIKLKQAEEAELVEVEAKKSWRPNKGDTVEVPPGPAIRIAGNNQVWLIPVTEEDGPALLAAINYRRRR